MELKHISITPKQTIPSPSLKDLLIQYRKADEADESHYFQPNIKASEICRVIDIIANIKSTIKTKTQNGDKISTEMYENVKEYAKEIITKCNSQEEEGRTNFPRKEEVLEDLGKKIAEQLNNDLKGIYLCVKTNFDHTVYVIKFLNCKAIMCCSGIKEIFPTFDIIGNGLKRTDEVDCWAKDDKALSFGKFTIRLDLCQLDSPQKNSSIIGTVTEKQFSNYIAKAIKEMVENIGITTADYMNLEEKQNEKEQNG